MGTRILIAEDETIIRLDLRALLEKAGFEVCAEAHDGEQAVELARREQPDLALLDVKMPKLDGIEAARKILDERPIPIVMVTAYGEQELVSRAVEAGVFGYLVKPFRETDLLPAIETARARHSELVELRAEADSLAEALAARKAIERAKGLLMEREGLNEQEAYARLRKASQISGRPLRVVAEALIATLAPLEVILRGLQGLTLAGGRRLARPADLAGRPRGLGWQAGRGDRRGEEARGSGFRPRADLGRREWRHAEAAGRPSGDGSVSLADLRGRATVVNVFASWCIPCKDEAPVLAAAARRHAGPVQFVAFDYQDFDGDGRVVPA